MRAARIARTGGPDVIELADLPEPAPGPGQVLVRADYAGVNFIDVYHRTGLYPQTLPAVLGEEGAGTIVALGAGVADLAVGARVAWASASGSYASHVVVPAGNAVPIADGLDTRIAAALMLQGMTAHYLARSTFALARGHTCVVHAAAGGVGLLLVQLARDAGARVIGVTSTDAKAAAARAAGCALIVNSGDDLSRAVRDATGGRGADVVYDSVGRATCEASMDALAPRGMLVLFGNSSGPVPPIDPLVLMRKGSLFVTRPTLRHYIATRDELCARAGDMMRAAASGALAVTIDRVLPLAEAGLAQRLLETRATSGKVLLDCR